MCNTSAPGSAVHVYYLFSFRTAAVDIVIHRTLQCSCFPSRRSSSMSITPAEDVLTQALVDLKEKEPQLGISKVHALLLKNNPDWIVSEKRTRKILQNQGLIVAPPPGPSDLPVYPSSRIIDSLDVNQWTSKVAVKYFDKKKGKGLVATEPIAEDEAIWREDPFIIAPEWYVAISSMYVTDRNLSPVLYS